MRAMTNLAVILMMAAAVAGCADLSCMTGCHRHLRNSTSLVGFLYPTGAPPPAPTAEPELHLPLRVGLAFLPSTGSEGQAGLDDAHKEALLEQIRQRFVSRKFIADIVVVPDYYLREGGGFEGLAGVQRLYGVDLMALVSYDQVAHEDANDWSLGYVTIVGAYVLKGTRHDVSTLIDLAVVDPATRSLVLRAGGFDNRHGNTTLVREDVGLRSDSREGFDAATQQMMVHFDAALARFESEVHQGRAPVRVSSRGGGGGGMGSMDAWMLLGFLPLLLRRWTPNGARRTMAPVDSIRTPG